jgi:hypothetical protein
LVWFWHVIGLLLCRSLRLLSFYYFMVIMLLSLWSVTL